MTNHIEKSPYSYFGSKRAVASIIWSKLGNVSNYIEPFAGSLSVLLANPNIPKIETINDKHCFIPNFWRAIIHNPEEVLKYADYPIHEIELHARHRWLMEQDIEDFKNKLEHNIDFYDTKIAGYWIYGVCASIGNNWLSAKGLKSTPILSSAGGGIHGLSRQMEEWFKSLQSRMRRVRVCSGDWKRIMSPSITFNNKGLSSKDITGVFLDPPYDFKGRDKVYHEENNVFQDVCKWAIENADNPKLRIAVCGYEGDYNFPDNWESYHWSANGGMANLGNSRGKTNATKEVIYFSPYCLK